MPALRRTSFTYSIWIIALLTAFHASFSAIAKSVMKATTSMRDNASSARLRLECLLRLVTSPLMMTIPQMRPWSWRTTLASEAEHIQVEFVSNSAMKNARAADRLPQTASSVEICISKIKMENVSLKIQPLLSLLKLGPFSM